MCGSWWRCRCSLQAALGWRFWEVGGFLGLWVIGYGFMQAAAPSLRRAWGRGPIRRGPRRCRSGAALAHGSAGPDGGGALAVQAATIRAHGDRGGAGWRSVLVFAMNSSIHSYMVLAYSDAAVGEPQRGLLLHGQRRRSPGGHPALRGCVPGGGHRRPACWPSSAAGGAVLVEQPAAAAGAGALAAGPCGLAAASPLPVRWGAIGDGADRGDDPSVGPFARICHRFSALSCPVAVGAEGVP
jgi:hypothetical protein